jgi:hypothetical protein
MRMLILHSVVQDETPVAKAAGCVSNEGGRRDERDLGAVLIAGDERGGDRMTAAPLSDGQQAYLYLVRLAWDLRELGLGSLLDLSVRAEPAVVIHQASTRLKITVVQRKEVWFFTWGHGRKQSAWVGAEGIVSHIARWATR